MMLLIWDHVINLSSRDQDEVKYLQKIMTLKYISLKQIRSRFFEGESPTFSS